MQQSSDFFFGAFYAILFCVLFILGSYLYLIRKPLAAQQELQKSLGSTYILLAINLLALAYGNHLGLENSTFYLCIGLAIADLSVALAFIYKVYRKHVSGSAVDNIVSAVETKNAVRHTSAQEEDDSTIVETDNENSLQEADEEAPIVNPNIEDMIFFQRVESLMATKKLFCQQEISREAVAAAIGTNRTYLTRSIKGATGKTFLKYITDMRTSYAATLLTTTDEPLDVIGTMAGFRSKSSYYRAFSAAYGCTPSEYRKR